MSDEPADKPSHPRELEGCPYCDAKITERRELVRHLFSRHPNEKIDAKFKD